MSQLLSCNQNLDGNQYWTKIDAKWVATRLMVGKGLKYRLLAYCHVTHLSNMDRHVDSFQPSCVIRHI